MGKKLYVGNLAYTVSDSDLLRMFEPHGTVQFAQVIMDRDTGRSKGFGFVEMGSDQEAQAAIAALNGFEVEDRALTVNEARPMPRHPPGPPPEQLLYILHLGLTEIRNLALAAKHEQIAELADAMEILPGIIKESIDLRFEPIHEVIEEHLEHIRFVLKTYQDKYHSAFDYPA